MSEPTSRPLPPEPVPGLRIQSVLFTGEGALITYAEFPADVRMEGQLVCSHQLSLSSEHPDYRRDLAELHDQAVEVLRNAWEDFENSPPYDHTVPVTQTPEGGHEPMGMGEE